MVNTEYQQSEKETTSEVDEFHDATSHRNNRSNVELSPSPTSTKETFCSTSNPDEPPSANQQQGNGEDLVRRRDTLLSHDQNTTHSGGLAGDLTKQDEVCRVLVLIISVLMQAPLQKESTESKEAAQTNNTVVYVVNFWL